jgi:hypothetical protein
MFCICSLPIVPEPIIAYLKTPIFEQPLYFFLKFINTNIS